MVKGVTRQVIVVKSPDPKLFEQAIFIMREDAFVAAEPEYIEEGEAVEEDAPKVVRRKQFPVRPMSLEDAILQMELLGHSFFVFVDIETERTNVIYLRKDGTLGLLEPEA